MTPKPHFGLFRQRWLVVQAVLVVVVCVLAVLEVASRGFVAWNLLLTRTVKALPVQAKPLSSQDLFGLTDRQPSNRIDDLLLAIDDSVRVHKTSKMDSAASPVRVALWLLVKRPNEALMRLDTDVSPDQLTGYLRAMAYGQLRNTANVEQALREVPDSLQYLRNTAHYAWDNRVEPDLPLTIASAEMFLRLAPHIPSEHLDIYKILSYASEHAGDRARAIEIAERWVEAAPTDCAANEQLAALYLRDRDYQNGFRVLTRFESNGGGDCSRFHIQMGQAYDLAGNLNQAIAHYRLGALRNANDAYAHWNLGEALYRNNQIEEAIPHLEIAEGSSYSELQVPARQLLALIKSNSPSRP